MNAGDGDTKDRLQEEAEAIVRAAEVAVRRTGLIEPLLTLVTTGDRRVRGLAEGALLGLMPELPHYQLLYAARYGDSVLRNEAFRLLVSVDMHQFLCELSKWSVDPDLRVREYAALMLGNICHPDAVPPLVSALDDLNMNVAATAALGLGRIGDASAVAPLIRVLAIDKIESAIAATDKRFGRSQTGADRQSMDKIVEAANRVRLNAAYALGLIGDKRATEPLICLLDDEDDRVCGSAVEALGKIGDKRATEPLIEILDDESDMIRNSVICALGFIGDQRGVVPLCNHLLNKPKRPSEYLIQTIASLNGREAIPYLRRFLNKSARSLGLRTMVANAIASIEKATSAVSGLPRAAGPDVRTLDGFPRTWEEVPATDGRPRNSDSD